MACTVSFSLSLGGPPGARFLQIDAVNSPLFCELEFDISTTRVNCAGDCYAPVYNPADGLGGPPPLVNFFSAWRISVPLEACVGSEAFPAGLTLIRPGLPDLQLTPAPPISPVVITGPAIVPFPPSDCGPSTVTVLTQPLHGTLTGVNPALVYTPDTGFLGTDSFTAEVTSCGIVSTQTVWITVQETSTSGGSCVLALPSVASAGGSGCAADLLASAIV